MSTIRRLVLDVLKPHHPSILVLSRALSELNGVHGVDIAIYEIDTKVENAKVTIEGEDLNYEKILTIVEENGASVHSIDKVSAGRLLIEEAKTPQDVA